MRRDARCVVDRCDLVGLVGCARLYQITRAVAIRILTEGQQVAGRIQSPLLLEGPGGDRRLPSVHRTIVERAQGELCLLTQIVRKIP